MQVSLGLEEPWNASGLEGGLGSDHGVHRWGCLVLRLGLCRHQRWSKDKGQTGEAQKY
jgi:hypothetical protein